MMASGAIDDYTYLWWDVRPHPNLGTVETRVFDQSTRLEHTLSLAALVQSLVHLFEAEFEDGVPSVEAPFELVDDNKVRAALRGPDAELADFQQSRQAPARMMLTDLFARLREHAEELGCAAELAGAGELLASGPEAREQLADYEAGGEDLRALVATLVRKS